MPSALVSDRLWLLAHWNVSTQKLPIAECDTPGTINSNKILVELKHFDHSPGSLPTSWLGPSLILDENGVTHFECWQTFRVFRPTLSSFYVAVSQCLFSLLQGVLPRWVWLVTSWQDWDEVLDWATKDAHSRRNLCVRVRSVPVLEHGDPEGIRIQFSSR